MAKFEFSASIIRCKILLYIVLFHRTLFQTSFTLALAPIISLPHLQPLTHDLRETAFPLLSDRARPLRQANRTIALTDRNESPICELCRGNGYVAAHCEHCDFSSDGDLICFRCHSDEGSSTDQICPRCEREAKITSGGTSNAVTSSSDEGNNRYPIDAVVKIQVNDRAIDVDSDETPESESSGNQHPQRGAMERLDTIVETKGDTASENDEENGGGGGGTKLNGTTSARYLNYMIVLFL